MKHIAKSVLKSFLIIVLFTGGSAVLSSAGVKATSTANAATAVSYNQVYEYLVSKGYTVISLCPSPNTKYDWVAHTVKNQVHYSTTIYCDESNIIGQVDVPM